jgi:hypothetical protein
MTMQKIFDYLRFFAFLMVCLIVSCTKVIDIDLVKADPKYVIEGLINKDDTVHVVSISQSVPFSSTNIFPMVSGAIVSIFDNLGNTEVLTELSPGKYVTFNLLGVEGRTYTLTVEVNGRLFTATSTMPYQVNLDMLYFLSTGFGASSGKVIVPIRQDPAGIQNNYKFDVFVKRVGKSTWDRDESVLVQNDELSDGLVSQQPLFGSLGGFLPNDSCKVSMSCIDNAVYKYFYSLSLNGDGGAATPANPISNISGGCLGFFSAQTQQLLLELVPE